MNKEIDTTKMDKFLTVIAQEVGESYFYWLSVNINGEISLSGPLMGGTIPNPANWYPNTDEKIFHQYDVQNTELTNDDKKALEEGLTASELWPEWFEELVEKAEKALAIIKKPRNLKTGQFLTEGKDSQMIRLSKDIADLRREEIERRVRAYETKEELA